jgi:hypothetical protein
MILNANIQIFALLIIVHVGRAWEECIENESEKNLSAVHGIKIKTKMNLQRVISITLNELDLI